MGKKKHAMCDEFLPGAWYSFLGNIPLFLPSERTESNSRKKLESAQGG